mmetsp:Transcript_6774/g.7413  ORF Transcript_6774/g.7413 Transcript_6774/m.7413 type:complete len:211 (+) Transcript_6774:101-733(+)|eukprot:CAMPEP_0168517180 /NCGR_PEP_ID=MMETSP0405-20121227/5874_1 /TAXON_ID=498012 /ORGANISM="Trichosphaerium sp, Strain Am-I-7 wt" /LENGTH=210 /DNA_ID=CAMNT_0008537093 /DNA_START=67 /DNA_END=699 /DNA_ORIENTATION=+
MATHDDFEANHEQLTGNEIKINRVILLNDDKNPCKVVSKKKSTPGKHGHAKFRVVGMDIFTGRKYEILLSAHDHVHAPEVKRENWRLDELKDDNTIVVSKDKGMVDLVKNTCEDLTKKELRQLRKSWRNGKIQTHELSNMQRRALGLDVNDDEPIKKAERETREDLKLPENEIGELIEEKYYDDDNNLHVVVTKCIGHEQITGFKNVKAH